LQGDKRFLYNFQKLYINKMSYCKDGEYSENGECKQCPNNTWSNSWNAPKGSVGSPSNQNTACKLCKQAYYSENNTCKACPDNYWSNVKATVISSPSTTNDKICKPCPSGSFTKYVGSSCYCPPGKKFFNGSCIDCESGTYQDLDTIISGSNSSCIPCTGKVSADRTLCTVEVVGGGVVVTPVAPTPVVPTPVAPTPVVPTPVVPTPVVPTPVVPETKTETKTGGSVTDGTSEISGGVTNTSTGSTTRTDTNTNTGETEVDQSGDGNSGETSISGSTSGAGTIEKTVVTPPKKETDDEPDGDMIAVIVIVAVFGVGLLILGGWAGYDWYKKKYGKN
jgi:hypothetical protein